MPKPSKETRAFLTGSHAYGAPREDSDVDVAVLVEPELMDHLRNACGSNWKEHYGGARPPCLEIGKLQFILFQDEHEFLAWRRATKWLKDEKPVTKGRAIRVIHALAGY